MNEIISSILEAEKKADEIITSAGLQAKSLVIEAEKKADKIRNDAVNDFKAFRKESIENADKKADKVYAEEIEGGNKKAAEIGESVKGKIDSVSDDIVKKIIDKFQA